MTKRYFGTDGIRGTVGYYPITPDFMLKLGWATGKVFTKKGGGKVLTGLVRRRQAERALFLAEEKRKNIFGKG